MSNIPQEQGSPSWIAFRKNIIGASDVSAILGINPWTSRYDLWQQKMGLVDVIENEAMRRGKSYEAIARTEFNNLIGKKTNPKVVQHPSYEWLVSSLDGISDDGDLIVEIKVPGAQTHSKAQEGIIEPHYNAQMQCQMACTGLKHCHFWSYNGTAGALVVVNRDDSFIADMLTKCEEFYRVNMLGFECPELDLERDYFNASNDSEWTRLEALYQDACVMIEDLTKKKDSIRNEMIEKAGGWNVKGVSTRLTKVVSRGRIDYSKIEALKEINLEPYRSPSTSTWRITKS